jgi:hypothetical protein
MRDGEEKVGSIDRLFVVTWKLKQLSGTASAAV